MLAGSLEESFSQLRVHDRRNTTPARLQAEQRHCGEAVADLTCQDPLETLLEWLTMNHQFLIIFCVVVAT